MAGDWLKVEASTPDKPEVFMIADRLKLSIPETFGRLFLVWRWFDQQTEDGNALAVNDSYLDHIAGVTGMAQAMREVGWLTLADNDLVGVKLPNFDRHNGKTAKSRALTARRVATHKQRTGNVVAVTSALAREEKRRDIKPTGDSRPESQKPRYWESPDAALARAKELGLNTRGESFDALKRAIRDKEAQLKGAAA